MIDRWRTDLTRLEQALAESVGSPLAVEPLGRLLMEGVLHAVPEEGRVSRPAVHVFGGGVYVSAYTSADRMRSVLGDVPALTLPGHTLLRAVRPPAELVLNLGTWPGRVVSGWELHGLLARWGGLSAGHRVVPPRHYPAVLLEALWDHFHAGGQVAEAHLAMVEGLAERLLVAFRAYHPAMADRLIAETVGVARAVYDADVHVLHLGADGLSRRVLDVGSRFFGEVSLAHPA